MSEGKKYDDGKIPLDLEPIEAIREVLRVLQYGKFKYDAHNWRKGMEWSRLYAAGKGHCENFWYTFEKDPENGLSHLAEGITNYLFLLSYSLLGLGIDDRWKPPQKIKRKLAKLLNRGRPLPKKAVKAMEEFKKKFGSHKNKE